MRCGPDGHGLAANTERAPLADNINLGTSNHLVVCRQARSGDRPRDGNNPQVFRLSQARLGPTGPGSTLSHLIMIRRVVVYKRSALKRGYSREDIERIISRPFQVSEVVSSTGDPAIAVQGHTSNAELIEIHYQRHEVTAEPIVFHVQVVPRGAARRIPPHR